MIPEGWQVQNLADVALIILGQSPPSSACNENVQGYPFYQGNADFGYRHPLPQRWIENPLKVAKKDDILISVRAPVGELNIANTDCCIGRGVGAIRPLSANRNFIYYTLLNAQNSLASVSQGSTFDAINGKELRSLSLLIPPLSEQKKIAAILSSVDDAIQAKQAVIDQTSTVKQGLLQQLLTRGIGHTRFKQTEIGEIPEEWEIVDLGEVLEKLQAGVSVNSEDRQREKGELGILKTSCVYDGFFDPTQHKTILKHEMNRASISPLKDHIIISRMNTPTLVGASGYVDRDYPDIYLPDRLWQTAVKDYTKTSARWLSYLLMSPSMRRILSEKATGTSGSMKNLSKNSILDVQIALPPINEQLEIKRILSGIDSSIDHHQEEVKILTSCKNGLMQDLLTGRVRVKLDGEATT
jgi:type I restriction enzyme, S subunit